MKRIIKNLKEYEKFIRDTDKDLFDNLKEFIEEVNSLDNDDSSFDFFKLYKDKNGEVIQPRNYIGLIQFKKGQQIQILPKIDIVDDEHNTRTKKIVIQMLRCLEKSNYKIKGMSEQDIAGMNIYDIFINKYLMILNELIKKGLKSNYVTVEDNLNILKGKLYFGKHIVQNAAHKEKFYCIFDEYQLNRPENRLIKATLLKLDSRTNSMNNKQLIKKSLLFFDEVEESKNYDKDFSEIIKDRSMIEYEQILDLSKVFLYNKSFTMFSGHNVAWSLLFPMNQLFEAYVGKKIRSIVSKDDIFVSLQEKKYFLYDEPRKFKLEPDIVIYKKEKEDYKPKVILDTKWKQLHPEKKDYDISPSDMYQMYVYAKKYNVSRVVLLYPQTEDTRSMNDRDNGNGKDKGINYIENDKNGNPILTISVYFVNLADINNSINKLKNDILDAYIK